MAATVSTLGIDALKLGYWGTQGYLNDVDKQAVMEWLRQRSSCQLEELVTHLDLSYGVVFKSQQSYYDLRSFCRTLVEEDTIGTSPEGRAASRPKKHSYCGVTDEMAHSNRFWASAGVVD